MKIDFLAGTEDEIRALPTRELQLECMQLIIRAGQGVFGLPLGPDPRTGDLSGCRKIYFGNTSWRVVVRYVPSERSPVRTVVLAVGARADMQVYHDAVQRLTGPSDGQ